MKKDIRDYFVKNKYGKKVKLAKENIKDIYFLTYCNGFK